ncbi:MAG: phosphoribosylformylglycinamidine synthase subunit PurL [Bacillota bacterium]|nr:MAG: phosphoribosylformylglycinamidine synthase subunit PurL [Bacillota bacterium]
MDAEAARAAPAARWERVGLTEDEYRRLVDLLGREPNDLELEMVGVMWSEHCSYKSSKVHLRRLPSEGPQVLMGPGENAGVLDLGDGTAVALRCESHNHPSAVEPVQGAATGVGGILRDIFTVGARPIALLDSLRFGPPERERNRYLLGGVVSGIAGYGNPVGVPTVGGEVYFEDCYADNPLVNVMAVGVLPRDRIVRGRAEGVGNPVFVVGARTGRDGIHGASLLASREFDQQAEDLRPEVQVGDPFLEKLLIEACLELTAGDAVVGVNDLGAAGLTSACSETASRAGQGIEIDVARVPRREPGMTPDEVMLSESQERMLIIARAGREDEVRRVFTRWGLEAAEIGRVTGDGMFRVRDGDRVVAELPARILTEQAPVYRRPAAPPADLEERWRLPRLEEPGPGDTAHWTAALERLLGSPNLCSRRWIWQQYDYQVRTNTVVVPGADAAVLRVPGSRKGIALAVDGNGRLAWLDPDRGARLIVAEAARNVACTGARPLGLTNCLNFASPERPETMWAFSAVIDGMAEAARALGTPVTGGNVSFYNETMGRGVYPTPVVGMLGVIDDLEKVVTPGFKAEGDALVLLGAPAAGLAGSEYLKVVHGLVRGRPPLVDLDLERRLIDLLVEAAAAGLLRSAHDLSDGGAAVALAEACFAAEPGAARAPVAPPAAGSGAQGLFRGGPARGLVSTAPGDLQRLLDLAGRLAVPAAVIGAAGGGRLRIRIGGALAVDAEVQRLHRPWSEAMARWMG